jgi:hypothetical protein
MIIDIDFFKDTRSIWMTSFTYDLNKNILVILVHSSFLQAVNQHCLFSSCMILRCRIIFFFFSPYVFVELCVGVARSVN